MVSSYVGSSPRTMEDYLFSDQVESSDEATDSADLLPAESGQDTGQSSESGEQVAPDADSEQPDTTDSTLGEESADSSADESTTAVSPPAWDSQDNPHYQDAEAFRKLRVAWEEQQQKNAEAELLNRWRQGGVALSEADEEDIPFLMDSLVGEISSHVAAPMQQKLDVIEHGMTALVAALESELDEGALSRVKEAAAKYRGMGSTASEIESAHTLSSQSRQAHQSKITELNTKIKNLTAQLAAKSIQDSGANRAESTSVGGDTSDELNWDNLLGG